MGQQRPVRDGHQGDHGEQLVRNATGQAHHLQQRTARIRQPIGGYRRTGHEADQQVHATGGKQRPEERARIGPARLGDFLRQIHRGLEPDERVEGQHRARQGRADDPVLLGPHLGEPGRFGVSPNDHPRAEPDDHDEAAEFDHGRGHVGAERLLDAIDVEQRQRADEHHHDQRGRQCDQGSEVVRGERPAQRGHRHDTGREHAEADERSRGRPERTARVVGRAARLGILRRQLGIGTGSEAGHTEGHEKR